MSKLVNCPKCRQPVQDDNLRCYYCGELLDISVGPLSFLSNSNKKMIVTGIAALLIILLLIWLF